MPGEIHGLVGQNGSGKSTLIKLISGVHKADPGGEVRVDGERIGPPIRPERLHHDGLSFVHQDLGLVSDLSVRENVRVGRHATRTWARWIDKRRDRAACRETFAFLKVDIDPDAPTASLAPSQRAAVAVARALQERALGKGVIVFDESSRAIPHEALPAFYDMVRLLASEGTSVLMVSHNLREVLDICDRVTVLRNGTVVESGLRDGGAHRGRPDAAGPRPGERPRGPDRALSLAAVALPGRRRGDRRRPRAGRLLRDARRRGRRGHRHAGRRRRGPARSARRLAAWQGNAARQPPAPRAVAVARARLPSHRGRLHPAGARASGAGRRREHRGQRHHPAPEEPRAHPVDRPSLAPRGDRARAGEVRRAAARCGPPRSAR